MKISILSALAVSLLAGHALALPVDVNFHAIEQMPCAQHARAEVAAPLAKRHWRTFMVRPDGLPITTGIATDDTREQRDYRVWPEGSKTFVTIADQKTHVLTKVMLDNADQCRPRKTTAKLEPAKLPYPVEGFTDADLQALLKKNKSGVIYVWTPYMPLSVKAMAEIKKAAADKGIALTVLLDPKAGQSLTKMLIDRGQITSEQTTRVASPEIMSRGVSLHYPSAIFYTDGYLSNRNFQGHKYAAAYETWMDFEKEHLREEMQ